MMRRLGLLAGVAITFACSGPSSGQPSTQENQGSSSSALTVVAATGFVPMPVLVDADRLPVQDPNGKPVAGWDGSTAELIAADSFAQCTLGSSFFQSTFATYARGIDEFLSTLRSRMQQTICHIDGESLYPIPDAAGAETIEKWLIGRMTPGCNIDPTTGEEAAISLPARDVSAYTSFTTEFAGTWRSVLSTSIADPEQAFPKLAQAVSYSELNLCMAQRMQEQLNSASILFASDAEQLELLGYIRERAQLAVLQYSLLGKVLAAPGPNSTSITNPNQLLPIFRAWGEAPSSKSALAVMGADFATAIRLDLEATNEFATLLRRQAGARSNRAEVGSRAAADWAAFTPRVRLLNLLYGGDPLTTSDAPLPGRGQGGAALRDLPFVAADMASPELGNLLGLARSANLLDFKYVASATDPKVTQGIDEAATAQRLYTQLERYLRQRVCDLHGENPCPAAMTLPESEDEYLLWTTHRIRSRHARDLVAAFVQAIGPSAVGVSDDPKVTSGYGYDGSMFHMIGEHSSVQIDGATWIHLDPKFDIRALSPQELAIRFDPGRFLPAQMDLNANYYEQGFVANRDVMFDAPDDVREGPGGTWEELRALGTVPVLAFARETILQGRLAGIMPRFFFQGDEDHAGAQAVLPLIERVIGSSTVAIRPDLVGVNKTGSDCPPPYVGPSPCRVLEQHRDGNSLFYNVDYLTTPTDPYNKVAVGNYVRDLETAAIDQRFKSFRGVGRADVDALAKVSPTVVNYGSGDSVRELRRFSVQRTLAPGSSGTACNQFIEQLSNGDLRFSVTFPQPQFYVEVFSRKNGVQNVAQNIVASEVANSGGGYTYSLVRAASKYAAGNNVEVRFYSYRSGQPGVFTPGPAEAVWAPVFTYGSGACNTAPSGSPSRDESITFLLHEEGGERGYVPLTELPRRELGGAFLGLGSSLNDLARDAWRFRTSDWSSPVLDAFNLPLDWVPPTDASLVGGQPGEESYQYFLRSAKAAADEATLAVKTAIDTVTSEAVDATALANTDTRAEKIGDLEKRSLCGAAEDCDLEQQAWMPSLDNRCTTLPASKGRDFCNTLVSSLFEVANGALMLPQVVVDESFKQSPDFSQFSGGQLQRILTAQWAAVRNVNLAVKNQVDAAVAFGSDINASDTALVSATADRDAKLQAAKAQEALVGAEAQEKRAQITSLQATISQQQQDTDLQCCTNADLTAPPCTKKWVAEDCFLCAAPDWKEVTTCSYCQSTGPRCGLIDGLCAGYSYSGSSLGTSQKISHDGGFDIGISGIEGKSWSSGPLRAAEAQCTHMKSELALLQKTTQPSIDALNAEITALDGNSGTSSLDAAKAAEAAANAAYDAASAVGSGARSKATAQFEAQLSLVQQAMGEVVKSTTELAAAETQKDLAVARAELDSDLASRELETRFGLRRKFQSYDLWRARALLESARRMAVAARRAIESRFVVDLSALDASQVFVEAPSLWADEIYDTDLNAPAAVGLSRSPTIAGAVFPNKLVDYVGNLERFVQGYTVAYPTSVAIPDTEVLSIPGPDLRIVRDVNGESIENVDAQSSGWQFSCGKDDSVWFGHPGASEYPLVTRLDQACSGSGPVRARFAFNLDPWARYQGDLASSDFNERHNVRWRRLAVNLVGTGVRDCQRAADPTACYSDSFVRYDLTHAGPSWVTNHAQQWRAFEIPTGRIEAAKALATEEWLDPISNSWNKPNISNVARAELFGRPVGGAYELLLQLTPDVRLERIERVQLLAETDYWVRQD
jgi:hypothetical protein